MLACNTVTLHFPITDVLPGILSALQKNTRLVLEAPPGAGKTTQVPIALLDAAWRADKKILMLEPRRVAARAAAGFMAKQLGEGVGETVGYRIRFENRIAKNTKIEVVTEGILTRMIQDDPGLENVAGILFDEFHERHLSADLGLALALDIQQSLREDLRIVVMSATLDGEKLAEFLQADRISSAGRSYPVSTAHFPARRDEALAFQIKRCVEEVLKKHDGDLLIFLPGQREIRQVEKTLEAVCTSENISLVSLYGDMPIEKQSEALSPDISGKRRIVLATNIAESSVTLPGVRVVIDSGLSREPRFDTNSGFSRLETVAISQASADQRTGRAGRVAEGWCYRLWPASQRLEPMRSAEISQTELSGLCLELAAWGSSDLRFVEAPPTGVMSAARDLLQRLNAIDKQQRITERGKKILALGTHPRIAAMLLAAQDETEKNLACDLAALIEARDPLVGERRDDWMSRWQALAAYRSGKLPTNVNRSAITAIDQASQQWRRRLRCENRDVKNIPAHALGDLLLHAFPERIARQHPNDPRRYQMANGRMAKIWDDSALFGEPWLAISECRFDSKDSSILRAAPLDEIRLQKDFPERFGEQDIVRWDNDARGLIARREKRFDQIILESKPAGRPDPAQAAQALCDAVGELGLSALSWTENLKQWRERVRCLGIWAPELALPDFSDEGLLARREQWLKPALQGKTRLDGLSEAELSEALKSELDWPMRQKIDQLAPTKMLVPSGMERAIEYQHDAAPILAVKLQELFGLADTPRICEGRITLTLHLLSPGGKPLQITQDLKGFWERTYPEVKKEMKGRYPRHPWPEDPWSATATHRAKPRGT
ncbi:MAG: ATP-dependent helicase HrpB [Arenimonas sp.]